MRGDDNPTTKEKEMMDELTAHDAVEYGRLVKQGGWRLGLLVARSVKRANPLSNLTGSKVPANDEPGQPGSGKATIKQFAKKAGVSDERVSTHLAAWERAAEAGVVPGPDKLIPGQDVKLPDADTWDEFYMPVRGGYNGGKGRTPTVTEAKATLDKLPEEERAKVAAEVVAGSQKAAEAVAGHAVAHARVTVAGTKKKKEAETAVRARNFKEEEGSPGWAIVKIGSRCAEVRAEIRMLVLDFQEAVAANPDDDELLGLMRDDITKLKADAIIAFDGMLGDTMDEALAKMLEGESR